MALHAERGILATSWEDIARRADVAVATVYRHFPSLDALVPACGEEVRRVTQPPRPERAEALFSDARSVAERVARLVRELCAFYERAARYLEAARRDQNQVAALAGSVASLHADRERLLRAVLRGASPSQQTLRVLAGLTDFAVWRALVDRGVPAQAAVRIMRDVVLCWLEKGANGQIRDATLSTHMSRPRQAARKET